MTESRNVIFIETPASTLVDSTEGNTTGDAISTHEDNSPAENTDICITNSEEIDSPLKKLSKLTSRNMDHATSAEAEEPAAEDADSDQTLETTQTGALPTDNELGGATRMGTSASGAVTPLSQEGLNLHQQRELRSLGLLTSPMASDAEEAHEKENMMEYAMVAETERRSDRVQGHRMEVYLDYPLATGNPVSEHSSDGEVITIPNTFKEAMEYKEMDSFQKHAVFDLVSPDSVPPEHRVIGTKWVFNFEADHTLKGREVVEGWGQLSGIYCGCTYAPLCRIQGIRMALAIAASEDWEVFQFDVQTAFLNAEVQEEVYVKTPPGYKWLDATTGRPNVMELKNNLYGLCQSPRSWFNTIDCS